MKSLSQSINEQFNNVNESVKSKEQEQDEYINKTINARVKDMMKNKEFRTEYKKQGGNAKQWAISQAVLTLMYSPKEIANLGKDNVNESKHTKTLSNRLNKTLNGLSINKLKEMAIKYNDDLTPEGMIIADRINDLLIDRMAPGEFAKFVETDLY